MSHAIRFHCSAMAILCLASWPLSSAFAQTETYKHGFCLGIAGTPPVNQVTRAFTLGPVGADLRAEFMQGLGKKYGANVRRDATGCRMFATAAEAEKAHAQLLDQVRGKPRFELDWLPKGATALTKAVAVPGIKSATPDSLASHSPP